MLKFSSTFCTEQPKSEVIVKNRALNEDNCLKEIRDLPGKKVLFFDKNLDKVLIDNLTENLDPIIAVDIECTEQNKSRQLLYYLQDLLIENGVGKDAVFIALGGGMLSDLITLLAATYLGGVKLCIIPSTLLSMVDACLGGKGAVNAFGVKNRIGVFYPASLIVIDPSLVLSQDTGQYLSGLAEVIKYSLIEDHSLFDLLREKKELILERDPSLLQSVIERCCMIKLQICEQDPYDRGQRRILNFGHTIAHAIEALEDFSLPHGEAVAFGMIIEARLSVQKQLLDHDSLCKIFDLIHGYGFALDRYKSVDVDMLYGRACQDKKNSGGLVHFVALKEIAEVSVSNGAFVHAMSRSELGLAIDWHRAMLEKSHDLSCC